MHRLKCPLVFFMIALTRCAVAADPDIRRNFIPVETSSPGNAAPSAFFPAGWLPADRKSSGANVSLADVPAKKKKSPLIEVPATTGSLLTLPAGSTRAVAPEASPRQNSAPGAFSPLHPDLPPRPLFPGRR